MGAFMTKNLNGCQALLLYSAFSRIPKAIPIETYWSKIWLNTWILPIKSVLLPILAFLIGQSQRRVKFYAAIFIGPGPGLWPNVTESLVL